MSVSLTGEDVLKVNDRNFKDFGDGDIVVLDFPNNIVEGKKGKGGNTIFAFNSTGASVNATVRVLRGSDDDKFLNGQLTEYQSDSSFYTLMKAEFVKRIGNGAGGISNDIYKMDGGIVQKIPNVKYNVEGDTEQAISEYTIFFANTKRTIA